MATVHIYPRCAVCRKDFVSRKDFRLLQFTLPPTLLSFYLTKNIHRTHYGSSAIQFTRNLAQFPSFLTGNKAIFLHRQLRNTAIGNNLPGKRTFSNTRVYSNQLHCPRIHNPLQPGYGPVYTIFLSVAALIFPYLDSWRLVATSNAFHYLRRTPGRALKAGALCTVARTQNWMPEEGDKVWMLGTGSATATLHCGTWLMPAPRAHAEHKDSYACDVPMSNHLERKHSELFPQHPRGPKQLQEFRNCQKGQYMLVRIPPHCSVKWKHRSYFNLEFTRHHETDTWKDDIMKVNKYGSYRLTVVPYGLMSLVNILSAIFSPSYPSVYMVDSSVMREARRRGGIFDGVVGELEEDEEFETAEEEYAAVEERGGTIEQCGVPTTKTRGSVKVKEMPAPRTEPRISAVIRYRRFQPDGDDIYQGYLYYLLQNIQSFDQSGA
ncbi:hypothetical protein BDD12DRAFT_809002 [Trichophaea hybrida]|nr:hypothetical protein BDD12DRAFT_809002 [Trichophaea hybrida]